MTSSPDNKTDLKNISLPELADLLESLGLPGSRARHIFAWLMRPGNHELNRMEELKKEIKDKLSTKARISTLTPATVEESRDGTRKYAFSLDDRSHIESVLIPEGDRHTLCLSSQVGCAMACTFCLTGTMGFKRNLQPSEIVNQVLAVMEDMVARGIKRGTHREFINNLVFMGMGEPLANYNNLIRALTILMTEEGLGFTERRVTVSTCGIAPRILTLGQDARVNLAISLHAADDDVRNTIMPVNSSYGVDELLAACRGYPLAKKRIVLVEYILLKDVNDSPDQARLLAAKLVDLPCRINLLPYNECEDAPYSRPAEETILAFQKILRDAGYTTLIRQSRGSDISAACGQLAGQSNLRRD
ncbi:MAG: 23S rRNA (adenine(2503)-C(2))-methyltransferase RlmN [Desulfobulbaceae bacterium]|uniref:Probable dual-specificity RNA methyltransferase RlmN n=1 Tax=Candidatus Desulfobia pelagia TaxID=2841692 RepID=A0A8J6NA90_9BACT|nr:23S rRNA (adenine(2503)-C(2))-methyltransferase RlmN [Candidatus Desulfobia pelagia]